MSSSASSSTRPLFWQRLFRPRNLLMLGIGLLAVIQLFPTWLWQTNPPVVAEPSWDSPQTRALAVRACFDCHSNQTVWPFYSRIAPASWLATYDVVEGREHLNFSEWVSESGEYGEESERSEAAEESIEVIRSGEMPPRQYLLLHPEAQLTPAEQQALINGLSNSLR
jgi:hypothetical protein